MSTDIFDINCPHCGTGLNLPQNCDWNDSAPHTMQCSVCDEEFEYQISSNFQYAHNPTHCLNNDNHAWESISTCANDMGRMRCEVCGLEIDPTMSETRISTKKLSQ